MKARFEQLQNEVAALARASFEASPFLQHQGQRPRSGNGSEKRGAAGAPMRQSDQHKRRHERLAHVSPLGASNFQSKDLEDIAHSSRASSGGSFVQGSSQGTQEAASILLSLSPQQSASSGMPTPPLSHLIAELSSPDLLAQLNSPELLAPLTGLNVLTSPGETPASSTPTSLFFDGGRRGAGVAPQQTRGITGLPLNGRTPDS